MKWEEPQTKKSHPDKTLAQHIEEVEALFKKLTDFYNIKNEYRELVKWVVRYHDHGKLDPNWSIDNPHNPPHAERSVIYIREKGIIEELKHNCGPLSYLIIYLILKHHSALYDETSSSDKELKLICQEAIRNLIIKKTLQERIEVVDSFGLFKLSDFLSASGIVDFVPKRPAVSKQDVIKLLQSRSGELDKDRWEEQLALCSLPDASLLMAYTGWGKTDASLLFFDEKRPKKIFYLFPTITAINKFYEKLNLAFGDEVEKYFYLYEYELASRAGESADETRDFILSYFQASNFLKPLVITTVDQFLLSFLQLGKYYSKRVMFRDAGLIIDEVHLLNHKMLTLMLHFIKTYFDIYRLKVLFMSATFSEALMRIVQEQLPKVGKLDLSLRYQGLCRIRYLLELEKSMFDMVDKIANFIKYGKKVLVVFNTVEAAVKFAKELSPIIEDKVLLLHGRFMYRDRVRKERLIDELKGSPHVLIATQVCEVSLDVSYDLLFTELAPVPSLVQRFGRVNRYGKKTEVNNVYVCKEYRRADQQRYPYDDEELKKAKDSLEELDPLNNEHELIKKYNELLSYELLTKRLEDAARELDFKALWERDERTAYFFSFKLEEEEVKKRLFQLRDEITTSIIPMPDCISSDSEEDRQLKDELEGLLRDWENKGLNYDQRQKLYGRLKGYFVPVPIWWVFGVGREALGLGLPFVSFKDKVYTSSYGFIKTEEWVNIIA